MDSITLEQEEPLEQQELRVLRLVLSILAVIALAATALEFLIVGLALNVWLGIVTIPILLGIRALTTRVSGDLARDLTLGYAFLAVGLGAWLRPPLVTSTAAFLLVPTLLGAILRRPKITLVGSILLMAEWGYFQLEAGLAGAEFVRQVSGLTTALVLMLLLPYLRQIDFRRVNQQDHMLNAHHRDVGTLVGAVRDPIATLDRARRVIACNDAAATLLRTYTGWAGQLGTPLPASTGTKALLNRMDQTLHEPAPPERFEVPGSNGRHWVEVAVVALRRPDGSLGGYCLVGHDLSDPQLTQHTIDRARRSLLNAVIHELNSPLTPVTLQVHLLHSHRLGPLNAQQTHALAVVRRNLDRLRGEHARLGKAILESQTIRIGTPVAEGEWTHPSRTDSAVNQQVDNAVPGSTQFP